MGAHRERHERHAAADPADVDAGEVAGGEPDGERRGHRGEQKGQRQALGGEAPVRGEAMRVEPGLVGEGDRGGHAVEDRRAAAAGHPAFAAAALRVPTDAALLECAR
jgi:hypothetical protein